MRKPRALKMSGYPFFHHEGNRQDPGQFRRLLIAPLQSEDMLIFI